MNIDWFRQEDLPSGLKSLRGIRSWQVNPSGELFGIYGKRWNHLGETHYATCEIAEYEPFHQIVSADCYCGFYAYFYKESLELAFPLTVVGVIEGFGRTTFGSRGFRCGKAKILALCVMRTIPTDGPLRQCLREGWYGAGYLQPLRYLHNFFPRKRLAGTEIAAFNSIEAMLSEYPTTDPFEAGILKQ